jgi:hypothetical protein
MSKKRLELAQLIDHVGDEVRKAHKQAKSQNDAVMEFIECEVEAVFEVEVEANGKVNLWAAEIGTSGTQTTTHRITLKYQALATEDGEAFQGNASTE